MRGPRLFFCFFFFGLASLGSRCARTLGPRDERRVRATDLAAWMFAFCASIPRMRLLAPESCDVERHARGSDQSSALDRPQTRSSVQGVGTDERKIGANKQM